MTSVTDTSASPPEKNYLNEKITVSSWLLSLDHKRIGLLYLISLLVFFLIGGAAALVFRLELLTPEANLLRSETYNKFFTTHGIVMIFFFLIPSIPAVLGNFLLPIMLGAKDFAFPKINLASWYVFMAGGLLGIIATIAGGVETGWTFYTPYSTMYANSNVILAVSGAFIAGFSSIMTALNFIVTIHKMRAPGLTWFRLPLFVWAMYATALVILLGTPVVAITLVMIFVERAFGFGIFDPALGGDPVLFQHLFWFYSHPAVYIMILPAMGVVSEVISCFSKRRLYGYKVIAFSSLAIAVIGFFVWGHHMFVSSQSTFASLTFSFLTFFVAVPTALKMLNWIMTLYKGSVSLASPMLYAFGFLGLFVIGGLTGLFLSTLGTDIHFHDTYFVVAHFHYVMVGGGVMGFLAGLHFWWPKMTGRKYPEAIAVFTAIVIFVGFNLTFFPQFQLGVHGMPRRYHVYPEEFQLLHIFSTSGAMVLGFGYTIMAIYLLWSLKFGQKAGSNPWDARGLEWETSSPPPTHNFHQTPVVRQPVYPYEAPSVTAPPANDSPEASHG
ncbi:MAG TPA: cbb3-type cytochrome c oxidase subunit I [Kiritimatiellia bacterium]|nr:cbb3-type cytochrome c oxidase subunit I [Kiritimatiellia bacterium]